MIAVAQARGSGIGIGIGKAYLTKQESRGKDKTAALQLLRRRFPDAVFTAPRADYQQHDTKATSRTLSQLDH